MPPTYDFVCVCGWQGESFCSVENRDIQCCPQPGCHRILSRRLAAPMGKMKGDVAKGGGPDRFTADMLGIKTGDLPNYLKADHGLTRPGQPI